MQIEFAPPPPARAPDLRHAAGAVSIPTESTTMGSRTAPTAPVEVWAYLSLPFICTSYASRKMSGRQPERTKNGVWRTPRQPADVSAPAARAGGKTPVIRPRFTEPDDRHTSSACSSDIADTCRRLMASGRPPTLQALARRHGVRLGDVSRALAEEGIDASLLGSWRKKRAMEKKAD